MVLCSLSETSTGQMYIKNIVLCNARYYIKFDNSVENECQIPVNQIVMRGQKKLKKIQEMPNDQNLLSFEME